MSDFDEKSGIVPCTTEFGQWWQTIDEVMIEITLPEGTKAKQIKCISTNRKLKVTVQDNIILEGDLPETVHGDETVWTIEDKKLLRICLVKINKSSSSVWESLLVGQYAPDVAVYDEMEQKTTLQRLQLENPGMDFSKASISGNYHNGGPQLPS